MATNHGAKILVVDDDRHIREIVSRWLTAEGYQCVPASSAEEAWSVLQTDRVSLIVTDIVMGGKSGMDLLVLTKKHFSRVAVIMMTGIDDRGIAIQALQLGAYGYVIKPFDQNEIAINVANALERRRLVLASRVYQKHLESQVRKRTAEIRRREEEIAWRLLWAAEYRDEETGAHIRRIGLYSALLAEALGWEAQAVENMRIAAPMHDVGKIGIPDRILRKPGRLTTEEFELVKAHPQIGARILDGSDIPLINLAKEIALTHHERWDGSGYPMGLAGKAIPESGRIVAVVDVYDALVHQRVYRPALPEEEAIALMSKEEGQLFDPRIFRSFLRLLPEFRRIRQEVLEASDGNRATRSSPTT